ncbi:MAG: hypothetical protein IKE75_02380 [Bacilli bacterium]|nr:hypothetical protein [Bacilli bacterium]
MHTILLEVMFINKKLPGVFPGKVKKNSGNNDQVYYSDKKSENTANISEGENSKFPRKIEKNINQKISDILNSPSYVYKADVEIKLKDKTVCKRIVGRNNLHLITIENELIPIADVVDISLKQK